MVIIFMLQSAHFAGSLVATIDRHSLFVWRAGHEITQPLNLHHTKPYTVSDTHMNTHTHTQTHIALHIE